MKHPPFFILLSFVIFAHQSVIFADLRLISAPIPPDQVQAMANLMDTITPYPCTTMYQGNLTQIIQNRRIKSAIPSKAYPILAKGNFSVLKPNDSAFQSYPGGGSLFPGYPDLSAKFDNMISLFKSNPNFIPFFRKVHINVLNELYNYLMNIYVNFNLQHVGITQDQSGALHLNIPFFLQTEQLYATNEKTLIINHLMNVIESQFNSAICSYVPNIPHTFATYMGKTLIQNDYSIDLTRFIEQQIEPELINQKKIYLQAIASYLSFFQAYTSYLLKPHPKQSKHYTAFVDIAETINQFLYAGSTNQEDKSLMAIAKMNPPLFRFTYDDIRAIQLIPYLAKSLPANTQKILWPEHIMQAADEGIIIDGHPLAYFKNENGKVVHQNEATKLFICIQNGQNLFEEELIAQPDWLQSWDGVAKILRACFGDFSMLLGLNILDPCMETMIENIVLTQQGKDPNAQNPSSKTCKALIESWKKTQEISAGTETAPDINSVQLPIANPEFANTSSNLMPTATDISPSMIQQGGVSL